MQIGLLLFGIAVVICLASVVVSVILHVVGKGELDRLFTAAACGALIIIVLLGFIQGLKIINGFMIDGYDFGPLSDALKAFEVLP